MFPGLSPIYLNPLGVQTNVPPPGNDPGWSFDQSPNVTIPNIPSQLPVMKGANPPRQPVEEDAPTEKVMSHLEQVWKEQKHNKKK